MEYKNKKIIIFGKNRFQRDFQYIYNNLQVAYYIDDVVQDQACPIDSLLNEDVEEIFVIICKAKHEHRIAIESLQERQFVHRINFCLADELFEEFDFDIEKEIAGRKVVVWGTGAVAKEFCDNYQSNYDSLIIDFFVDNDINKCGQTFCGKRVEHINSIEDWSSYYVIIAIADYKYDEINKVMEEKGLKNNYTTASRLLLDKPSTLLKKTIYDANQYGVIQCSKIDDMRILKDGKVCPCCMAGNYIMGNVFLDKPEDIWNSSYERIFRLSILNKSYTFCDGKRCPLLVNRRIDAKNEADSKIEARKVEDEVVFDDGPKQPYLLLLELDNSCNIMCTSCRDNIIIEESFYYECLCNKIIENYLGYSDRLIFTGNGEVLASKYGKKILASEECKKRQKISILTNGLAFNQYHWDLYFSSYSLVDVSISIDAASEVTYERIRRKSNWRILNDNLTSISQLKREGKIGFFQINFVVQKNNVHEMADYVRLGKKYNVDRVLFSMLENWNYSEEEYAENSIMDKNNLIKDEYKSFFQDEILNDEMIDYTNIAQAIRKQAKNAYMY